MIRTFEMYEDGGGVSSVKSQICLDNKGEMFYFLFTMYKNH